MGNHARRKNLTLDGSTILPCKNEYSPFYLIRPGHPPTASLSVWPGFFEELRDSEMPARDGLSIRENQSISREPGMARCFV
jgi:hypothetical protein